MSGLSPGDTLLIVDGTYSSVNFQGLNHIVILPQTTRTYFSGPGNFKGNTGCKWRFASWRNYTGNALDIRSFSGTGGNLNHDTLMNMDFQHLKSSVFLAHGNWLYTAGDTTTYGLYRDVFDSLYEYDCNELMEGSFGSPSDNSGHPPDVFDSVTISRFVSLSTSSNVSSGEPGTEVRGIQFDCNYHDWARFNPNTVNIHGDDGMVYGHGNGNFYNMFSAGGPGYVIRIAPCAKVNTPNASVNIWNVGKFNSKEYGLASIQSSPSDSSLGVFHSCNTSVYNTTQVNAGDSIGYWCQNVVVGDLHGYRCQIRNNLGANITTNGKPNHVIMNQSSDWTTIASDTSNNVYYTSATQAMLDSITTAYSNILGNYHSYKPTILSVGITSGGTSNPFSLLDYYNKGYRSTIGYAARDVGLSAPLSFSIIPYSSNDIIAPGRSAELWGTTAWDGTNVPYVPPGNTTPLDSYQRFVWGQIEPSQGVYSFTDFDGYVQRAINNHQMFSFGVMSLCSSCDMMPTYGYPTYLHNLMQSETIKDWHYTGNGYDLWVPNWNSPNFLGRYAALMTAFANHINTTSYNGVPFSSVIYWVEPRGYGDFGEWHTYPWIDSTPANEVATESSLESIVNAVKTAFPNTQLVIPMAAFDTDPTHSSRLPAQFGYYVLTTSNSYGQIGWRRDNYGDPQYDSWLTNSPGIYNGIPFTPLIMNKYKYAPIGGEPNNSPYYSGTSTPFSCPIGTSGLYCNIVNEVTLFGVTSFGNGNYPLGLGGNSGFVNNIVNSAKFSGYRLVLDSGYMTPSLISNNLFNISVYWKNVGIAPNYENWNVIYELRTSGGSVVWTGTSAFKPKMFEPTTTTDSLVTENFNLGSVAAGTYNMFLVIRDPNGYKNPLPLAISGRNGDGSYTLKTGITVSTSSAPVANAGLDQSITLPTNYILLDGTASSGTITSYLWTQISGPNTASLGTPTTVTCGATGLIQGTYVFQLSLNGGVSTGQVQITVNQAIIANAGTDQIITLPTSSVTLNGSGSSGAITSYLWTRVSGPNTPTIVTPSTVSTNITGLIQGTYTFKLSVNGGVSTDQVTITVNPAPIQNPQYLLHKKAIRTGFK